MRKRPPPNKRRPIKFVARDAEFIRAVNDYRALTAAQLQRLFAITSTPMQRRLIALWEHEYLDCQEITVFGRKAVNAPYLYTIGSRGVRVLVDVFEYDRSQIKRPRRDYSWRFSDHLLALNNFRVAVAVAAQEKGWLLETWLDERVFRQNPDYVTLKNSKGKSEAKPVYPDGYFCLSVPQGRAHFLVEVDRGTELRKDFRPQILVYEEYVKSGAYGVRFSERSLRILIVTTTPTRVATLKKWTASADGDDKYWFTTSKQATDATVLTGTIWQQLSANGLESLIDPP